MTTLFGDEPQAKKKSKRTESIGYNPVTIWVEEYKRARQFNPGIDGAEAKWLCDAACGSTMEEFRLMCRAFLECDNRMENEIFEFKRGKNKWKAEASRK